MCLLAIRIFSLVKCPFTMLPIFNWVSLFIESQEFFICSRYKPFIRCDFQVFRQSVAFGFLVLSLEAQRF